MIKLVGSLCVLSAGGAVWYLRRQEQRKRRRLLSELITALGQMESEIRMDQTPLPPLFQRLAQSGGPEVSALFRSAALALRDGREPEDAWSQAVAALPLPEMDALALSWLIERLQGSEQEACKGISLVTERLRRTLSEWERRQPEEEKRAAGVCFSAAALLVILLI